MEQPLYRVSGKLPKGFLGHIAYTTVLPKELTGLRLVTTFDKREPAQDLDALRAGCLEAVGENAPGAQLPDSLLDAVLRMPKAEINMSVFFDGACVGCAHRDSLKKEVYISPERASAGFLNCRPRGLARIVLHVYNILNDDTEYTLELLGVTA